MNTVKAMDLAAKSLLLRPTEDNDGDSQAESDDTPAGTANLSRPVTIIAPHIESDEEVEGDDDFDMDGVPVGRKRSRKSVAVGEKLRPMSKIIGFAA